MRRLTVAGHSLHPMLIVFPLGLLITSLVWDIVYLATGDGQWSVFAFWTIVAGIVGGGLAAIPGLIDWKAIPPRTRANRIATFHLLLNLCVFALFAVSLVLRASDGIAASRLGSMAPGWAGIAVGAISGWLGGELVEQLGVGVHDGANVNAPSSLRRRPPADRSRPHPAS
jgi:uncharacterized membrane protein